MTDSPPPAADSSGPMSQDHQEPVIAYLPVLQFLPAEAVVIGTASGSQGSNMNPVSEAPIPDQANNQQFIGSNNGPTMSEALHYCCANHQCYGSSSSSRHSVDSVDERWRSYSSRLSHALAYEEGRRCLMIGTKEIVVVDDDTVIVDTVAVSRDTIDGANQSSTFQRPGISSSRPLRAKDRRHFPILPQVSPFIGVAGVCVCVWTPLLSSWSSAACLPFVAGRWFPETPYSSAFLPCGGIRKKSLFPASRRNPPPGAWPEAINPGIIAQNVPRNPGQLPDEMDHGWARVPRFPPGFSFLSLFFFLGEKGVAVHWCRRCVCVCVDAVIVIVVFCCLPAFCCWALVPRDALFLRVFALRWHSQEKSFPSVKKEPSPGAWPEAINPGIIAQNVPRNPGQLPDEMDHGWARPTAAELAGLDIRKHARVVVAR
ncbi:unnamed protein product [Notodromas monacha]|uniref:Uncharacterized protein n=1 Tax=Notodromas monacha TaxID=399045 RepID=A0A7R9BRN3_9CRUS|nr:unnamed protein product [Notodromas monacha]CAG0919547.1 unnamed protein product [Notodromas monacha]